MIDPKSLDGCEALTDLDERERALVASLGTVARFDDGERIIRAGAEAESFFIVLRGQAVVSKDGRRVAVSDAGSILGEMSLFYDDVRAYDVDAVGKVELLEIRTSDFSSRVLRHEPPAVKLMQALGRLTVGRLQAQETDLARRLAGEDRDLADRLASFGAVRKRMIASWALRYHAIGRPGKIAVQPTKASGTAADLAVAYSPGVAEPCLAIRDDPGRAYEYTSKGQLVGVITNGTAVLGLGDIGALAGKPVMEGKAVLFKRFADVDAIDIEVDRKGVAEFVEVVAAIAPTFGGINLEDIRAPECFEIERECCRRLDIPVFHDDQHGTAIIAGAGVLNALRIAGKSIEDIRVVFSGAGAAGFATAKHLLALGVRRDHLTMTDVAGVVFQGRGDGNYLDEMAADTDARTLADAIAGVDVFVGVSAAGVLKPEMLETMAADPIVFALANPTPEIDYSLALRTRDDVIMATGRSDYPNQVNNVIAFPYVFRGALDCRAREIDQAMKVAATHAIAEIAREPVDVGSGSTVERLELSRSYIIPRPFDRRLLPRVASTVAKAAMDGGVARVELDLEEYVERLERMALDHLSL